MSKLTPSLSTDLSSLKKAHGVIRALNHPLRQRILKILDAEKGTHVSKIYTTLRMEQSLASQHLAIMRRVGIVLTDRKGKFIFYRVNHNRISQILQLAEQLGLSK